MAPRKGKRKETKPMARVGASCRRKDSGSIPAPARNVSTTEAKPAKKLIQALGTKRMEPKYAPRLPATNPRKISTRATEMPMRMEMRLASSATAIQAAVVYQTCSMLFPLQQVRYPIPKGSGPLKKAPAHEQE